MNFYKIQKETRQYKELYEEAVCVKQFEEKLLKWFCWKIFGILICGLCFLGLNKFFCKVLKSIVLFTIFQAKTIILKKNEFLHHKNKIFREKIANLSIHVRKSVNKALLWMVRKIKVQGKIQSKDDLVVFVHVFVDSSLNRKWRL